MPKRWLKNGSPGRGKVSKEKGVSAAAGNQPLLEDDEERKTTRLIKGHRPEARHLTY